MQEPFRKILLSVIYAGVGLILLSPILVDNRFFFPFITTKVFLFRIAVEIILAAFLFLNFVSEEYRPRWNWLLVFLAGFIGVAALASVLGGNFYLSFWGDIERGEGVNLWLHLLAFFVILTSTVKTRSAWAGLLDFSLGASLLLGLFGLGQALKIESLLATSGDRVDSTLGNPAFFAAYLLFHIAIALFLMTFRKSKAVLLYYLAVILFYIFLVFATQTRGAVLGLLVGIVGGALLLVFVNRNNPRLRLASAGLILLVVAGAGSLWIFRQSALVQNSFLRRIVTISIENRTAQTRFATWGAAFVGWKEKPILGWGLENFDVVFNKNFPPIIYADEGSQVWFDRAHNVILDRGVSTGAVGLGLFLAFLLYPAYYLLRYRLRDPETRNTAVIGVGLTAAYFIQDLFIFETVVIYMMLFFLWAFLSSEYLPQYEFGKIAVGKRTVLALAIVYALALGPLSWKINFGPLAANIAAAEALRADPAKDDFFAVIDKFERAFEKQTYGTQEYRLQFIEWVDQQLANVGQVVPEVKPVLAYVDEQAEAQIAEAPENAKNWLLVMRHYNYTFAAVPETRLERLHKALELYRRLAVLSPTRPHVDQEAGYSHLYLYREYKNAGDNEKAASELAAAEAMFRRTIELNPRVVESYINLIMLYLNSGDDQRIREVIALMDERGVNFRVQDYLSRLSNLARANSRLSWIGYFNEEVVKLNPDNAQAWINVALSYAASGDRARALELAEKIKGFGGDYVAQAELFIENVKRGVYEK